ncbi:hypothetical protein ACSLOE_30660, partial [Escherichia coli]
MSRTLEQKIADAEARLQRLKAKSRSLDTAQKVVVGAENKKPIKTMRCNKAELQVSNTPPPTLWKPSIHAGSAHITC